MLSAVSSELVDLLDADLVEMSVKSGGEVYVSRRTNTPVVSEASSVKNAGKQLMFVSCRVWHNVSSAIR